MYTLALRQKQNLSLIMALSMIFSVWFVTMTPVDASILSTVANVGKSIFVNGGALAAGAFGGVLGAAVGGGPLGMAAGAIGGFIVGKKVLNWTVSSFANFATVAGAIAGGALTLGMGLPMMAVGIIGGGLLARFATSAIAKIFGKKPLVIKKSDIDPRAAAAESAAAADFIAGMNKEPATTTVTAPAAAPAPVSPPSNDIKDSQTAYEKYVAAYKGYMEATQKGDAQVAQAAYGEYRKYLDLYNALIKAGK